MDLKSTPHRRYSPLIRNWVLVSPHRTDRPWSGKIEKAPQENSPAYDPNCYLCPGNARAQGHRNPKYESIFVFDNDYPALEASSPEESLDTSGLLIARAERGICRVICFSPRHDLTLSTLSADNVRRVVDAWAEQYTELSAVPWIQHVQIFENRGDMMGTSNPHPHGQIWANETVPSEPALELESFREFAEQRSACLLCEYLRLEVAARERLVCENEAFAALVPFWATWPFELLVISKRHLGAIDELNPQERILLAAILRQISLLYDALFHISFPYSMGFHQKPTDGAPHSEWHFHAHYYPPLLRSANIRKFMVGYEMLAEPQRDITPELAAKKLREV